MYVYLGYTNILIMRDEGLNVIKYHSYWLIYSLFTLNWSIHNGYQLYNHVYISIYISAQLYNIYD